MTATLDLDADFAAADEDAIPSLGDLTHLHMDRLGDMGAAFAASVGTALAATGLESCAAVPQAADIACRPVLRACTTDARMPGPVVLGIDNMLTRGALDALFGGRGMPDTAPPGRIDALWTRRFLDALWTAVASFLPLGTARTCTAREALDSADVWAELRCEVTREDARLGAIVLVFPWFRPGLLGRDQIDWSGRIEALVLAAPVGVACRVACADIALDRLAALAPGDVVDLRVERPAVLVAADGRIGCGEIDEDEQGTRFALTRLAGS
jgi:hypothetical protein